MLRGCGREVKKIIDNRADVTQEAGEVGKY